MTNKGKMTYNEYFEKSIRDKFFGEFIPPLVRSVMPSLVANSLVSVQPMTDVSDEKMYEYTYRTNKGQLRKRKTSRKGGDIFYLDYSFSANPADISATIKTSVEW